MLWSGAGTQIRSNAPSASPVSLAPWRPGSIPLAPGLLIAFGTILLLHGHLLSAVVLLGFVVQKAVNGLRVVSSPAQPATAERFVLSSSLQNPSYYVFSTRAGPCVFRTILGGQLNYVPPDLKSLAQAWTAAKAKKHEKGKRDAKVLAALERHEKNKATRAQAARNQQAARAARKAGKPVRPCRDVFVEAMHGICGWYTILTSFRSFCHRRSSCTCTHSIDEMMRSAILPSANGTATDDVMEPLED